MLLLIGEARWYTPSPHSGVTPPLMLLLLGEASMVLERFAVADAKDEPARHNWSMRRCLYPPSHVGAYTPSH